MAVRIPQAMAKDAGLAEGDRLSIDSATGRSIVLRFVRRKYLLDEVVAGISKKNSHSEWG